MKKIILRAIYFGALVFCVVNTLFLSIGCIVALWTGGTVRLNFNVYGENLSEAIVMPVVTGIAIAGLVQLLRSKW